MIYSRGFIRIAPLTTILENFLHEVILFSLNLVLEIISVIGFQARKVSIQNSTTNSLRPFKFLLIATIVCAAFTLIGFLIPDSMMQWDFEGDHRSYLLDLQWTSGVFSTLYAMWNCYVMTLLILYAPSHKNQHQSSEMDLDLLSEQSEFSRLTEGDTSIKATTASRSMNPPQVLESEMQLLHNLSTKQAFD